MKKFDVIVRATALAAITLGSLAQSAGAAATFTPAARILRLVSGWNDPHLRIVTDSTFYNPDGCPMTDGYLVPATLAANQQITAMAIAAHAQQQKVILTVDGCYLDRPRVVGIAYGNIN